MSQPQACPIIFINHHYKMIVDKNPYKRSKGNAYRELRAKSETKAEQTKRVIKGM